jgi:hypothetical protein
LEQYRKGCGVLQEGCQQMLKKLGTSARISSFEAKERGFSDFKQALKLF